MTFLSDNSELCDLYFLECVFYVLQEMKKKYPMYADSW